MVKELRAGLQLPYIRIILALLAVASTLLVFIWNDSKSDMMRELTAARTSMDSKMDTMERVILLKLDTIGERARAAEIEAKTADEVAEDALDRVRQLERELADLQG